MSVMDIVFLIMIFVSIGLPFIIASVSCFLMVYNDYKERKLWEKWYNDK